MRTQYNCRIVQVLHEYVDSSSLPTFAKVFLWNSSLAPLRPLRNRRLEKLSLFPVSALLGFRLARILLIEVLLSFRTSRTSDVFSVLAGIMLVYNNMTRGLQTLQTRFEFRHDIIL